MKTIYDISTIEIERMLEAIENGFSKVERKGVVTRDWFSGYFDRYQKMLSDLHENYSHLRKTHSFTENMTYGGCIQYLLETELHNRGKEYAIALKYGNNN